MRDIFKFLKHFTQAEKNYKGEPAWGDSNKVNGLLLRILDDIREEAQRPIVIHAACEIDGHAENGEHPRGDAIDFHFVHGDIKSNYLAIIKVLDKYGLTNYPSRLG